MKVRYFNRPGPYFVSEIGLEITFGTTLHNHKPQMPSSAHNSDSMPRNVWLQASAIQEQRIANIMVTLWRTVRHRWCTQCVIADAQCFIDDAQCVIDDAQCIIVHVQWFIDDVQCVIDDAQCVIADAQCVFADAQWFIDDAQWHTVSLTWASP